MDENFYLLNPNPILKTLSKDVAVVLALTDPQVLNLTTRHQKTIENPVCFLEIKPGINKMC